MEYQRTPGGGGLGAGGRGRPRERGVMLVLVTTVSILIVALVAALFTPAVLRHKAAEKTEWTAKCLYAADAGANKAKFDLYNGRVDGFTDELRGPDGNGGTADDGTLGYGNNTGVVTYETLANGVTLTYTVKVVDDVAGSTTDTNDLVIIRSTGTGNGISKTVEIPVQIVSSSSWTTNKAVLINGNFSISGNADISGLMSNVHANGNLDITGSPTIDLIAASAATMTVSGSPTINGDHLNTDALRDAYGAAHSNAAQESVPDVDVSVFLSASDYVLVSSGAYQGYLYNAAAQTYTNANSSSVNGWKYNGNGTMDWTFSGNTWTGGTYYIEGTAHISGSPGSNNSPVVGSVITTGSLEVTGSPHFIKDHNSIMFACGADLKIAGNPDLQQDQTTAEGAFLVKGQLAITGAPGIRGSLVVKDEAVGSLVSANDISGNASIEYDGLLAAIPELVVTHANITSQMWSVK